MLILAIASLAGATSFRPPPPVAEQLLAAAAAGVYVVTSTTTVTLDEGQLVTNADIEAVGTPVRGAITHATLRVPGGYRDGRYIESIEGAPRIEVGETLFVVLKSVDDFYIVANGWPAGLFRQQVLDGGRLVMVDVEGRPVVEVPCTSVPTRAVASRSDEDPDGPEEPARPPSVVVADDPFTLAMAWDDAVSAFATCGGGP